MSTQMKSFITTLDLVMRDKVDPETVVEEDEIEETLILDEDGKLLELHDYHQIPLADRKPSGHFDSWGNRNRKDRPKPDLGDLRHMYKDKPKTDLGDLRHLHKDDYDKEKLSDFEKIKRTTPNEGKIQKIEEIISSSDEINEIKKLSLMITEASMTREHYTEIANIIASVENTNIRKIMMNKFANDLANKYENFKSDLFVNYIMSSAGQAQTDADDDGQMPAGESETETDAMVNIPGVGVKVVPKDSEEYQKATQGIDGYGLAESV